MYTNLIFLNLLTLLAYSMPMEDQKLIDLEDQIIVDMEIDTQLDLWIDQFLQELDETDEPKTKLSLTPRSLENFDRFGRDAGFTNTNQKFLTEKRLQTHLSNKVPICSSKMNTIYRQAKMAATLLVNDYSESRRKTRGISSLQVRSLLKSDDSINSNSKSKSLDLQTSDSSSQQQTNNPGKFCKSLHNKLKRVYADIILIENDLEKSLGKSHVSILKTTLMRLKEALQEQMNDYDIKYVNYNVPSSIFLNGQTKTSLLTPKTINGLWTRAESQIDGLVSVLGNLNTGCNRLKRSISLKTRMV